MGLAAVGEEIGHLIAWSLLLGIVAADEAEALRTVVLAGYTEGLREAGWPGSAEVLTRDAAKGVAIAAALRWAFSAANRVIRLATDETARAATEQSIGQPIAAVIAERARLVYFLLDWLDEAHALLPHH